MTTVCRAFVAADWAMVGREMMRRRAGSFWKDSSDISVWKREEMVTSVKEVGSAENSSWEEGLMDSTRLRVSS